MQLVMNDKILLAYDRLPEVFKLKNLMELTDNQLSPNTVAYTLSTMERLKMIMRPHKHSRKYYKTHDTLIQWFTTYIRELKSQNWSKFFLEGDKVREIPIKDRTGKTLHLKLDGRVTPKRKLKKDKLHFKISKVVWGQQSNDQDKVLLIEELTWDDGRKELRFGYRTQTHEKGLW